MEIISIIGTIFSIWSVGISLAGESNAVKFRRYRKKGIDMKESKQLRKAILWYKKALGPRRDEGTGIRYMVVNHTYPHGSTHRSSKSRVGLTAQDRLQTGSSGQISYQATTKSPQQKNC